MKVATWNVNSVRARLDDLLSFLEQEQPDVVGLQELKCATQEFPSIELRAAGYTAAVYGQPAYNGVALLSRLPVERVRDGLDGEVSGQAPQARAISARIGGIEFLNLYVPNGSTVGSDKWSYKLAWLEILAETLESRFFDDEPVIVMGDFNIAPDDRDVWDPPAWASSVLCDPAVRNAFDQMIEWGFDDAVRHLSDETVYTWWDYRGDAYPQNQGLRIDHILTTRPLTERLRAFRVCRGIRETERPSDHAPVLIEFD